mmetsp:Transcript_4595/g.6181  ORF Transcript_4595/g.6181 Transcript_4595/m.6181 type:complete len:178 (+) Transcript_4595:664-1197(+)
MRHSLLLGPLHPLPFYSGGGRPVHAGEHSALCRIFAQSRPQRCPSFRVLALDPGNKLCGEMQEVLLQKIALDEESSEEEQEEDGEGESESEEDVEEGVEEGMQGLNLQDPEGEEGSEPDSNSGSDSDSDQEATEPIQYATEAPSTIPPPALVKVMQQLLEEDKANPQNNPPTSSTWK